jgi:hypothetical protein
MSSPSDPLQTFWTDSKTHVGKKKKIFKYAYTRVARWFVFKPKIPILKKILGLRLVNICEFYDHLDHFMNIWDSL